MKETIVCVLRVENRKGSNNNNEPEVYDRFVGSPEDTVCYLINKYSSIPSFFKLPAYMTIGFIETAKKIEKKINDRG